MRPVPEYNARNWLLKALRETSNAMESMLWNLDDDSLERRIDEDEWTCAELVRHVSEMERRYVQRLERMARMEEPRIDAFDADSILAEEKPDRRSAYEMADEFAALRRQAVYLLWSLDDEDWDRRGVHPYLGPLTILQVAREMNEHDLAHLWQLRRTCDILQNAQVV